MKKKEKRGQELETMMERERFFFRMMENPTIHYLSEMYVQRCCLSGTVNIFGLSHSFTVVQLYIPSWSLFLVIDLRKYICNSLCVNINGH